METIIHRGSREVGGNCIEVKTNNTRIVIDVGMPLFDEQRKAYDVRSLSRLPACDLRAKGILQEIPGLFELDRSNDDSESQPRVDAILLSHAHQDHTGLLPFTRIEIPVFGSSGTSKMMMAGAIFANQVSIPRDRFNVVDSNKRFRIGDIGITPIPVDHSIYGSVAFLLEADDKKILYSGDLRMHGRKPGMMRDFLNHCRDLDELLMEGTHVGLPNGPIQNEYAVEEQLVESMTNAQKLVLISVSVQNLDRLVGMIRAAKRTNRTLVLDFYSAFILYLISNEVRVPTLKSDSSMNLFVSKALERKLKSGKLATLRSQWSESEIRIEDLRSHPERYAMIFQNSMLQSDFEGCLPNGTRLIFSRWEGYLRQDSFVELQRTLDLAGGKTDVIHTSGHIYDFDLAQAIETIRPRSLKPIHTFEPEALLKLNS